MNSYVTSYAGLFGHVERVEIPFIQRDYAQGREGQAVQRIRASFLDVLHAAVTGAEPVGLDFVYGQVEGGTLRPLDGQQRLTTLFLLHWYLASRAGELAAEDRWKRFSYATRPSARLFCERLVEREPPKDVELLSDWLQDQSWFLYTWKHDPTIQSMLVMIDAIHDRFRNTDCQAAWRRLTDAQSPAVAFHVLPMAELGADLYIKMNSRGKPLTPFETFKARFEQLLDGWCPRERVAELALKLDGVWTDIFWRYHGGDHIVDDEMLRYFHFITEVCEWREGVLGVSDVEARAESRFGSECGRRTENLEFLFHAFDSWVGVDIAESFEGIFSETADQPGKLLLFGREGGIAIDLFEACVRGYGTWSGKKRIFSLPDSLLLYAVLLHRIEGSGDVVRRLRTLRNLIEASSNEIRVERMPMLLEDVRRIVVAGTLDDVSSFNTVQVNEERQKRELVAKAPELEPVLAKLEDHPTLRGALAAFDLDAEPSIIERRAEAFSRIFAHATTWRLVTAALLAVGDYSRKGRFLFQLGSGTNEAPWRSVFVGSGLSRVDETRSVLGGLLDQVAADGGDTGACLEGITARWIDSQTRFDWRWYFAKYPSMREGASGIYLCAGGALGFDVCMLDKSRTNSWYRDPYLQAVWRESGVGAAVEEPWFLQGEREPRWMRLVKSGVELRCVEQGFELHYPSAEHLEAFDRVRAEHGVGDDLILRIEQEHVDGRAFDTRDRVALGAALLGDMVKVGL